jgi:hypothetical protein
VLSLGPSDVSLGPGIPGVESSGSVSVTSGVAEGVAVAGIKGVSPNMGVLPKTGVMFFVGVVVGEPPGEGRLQPVSKSRIKMLPIIARTKYFFILSSRTFDFLEPYAYDPIHPFL